MAGGWQVAVSRNRLSLSGASSPVLSGGPVCAPIGLQMRGHQRELTDSELMGIAGVIGELWEILPGDA